ncbi:hypothetical protein AB9B48_23130 [Kluyvera ascorbata]|uniref:hypothetical protein n=1 Tax=Kluyvera ascorbata TaxID=51288 RepID=UPI0020684B72|nr:hypothetical protein [Kluyvera ascorbata]UPQ73525.1 hypothetical protein MY052_09760 [Kluyvera ascorbata]
MMDNMIISGIRIYFPKSEEPLPTPEKGMQTFAIRDAGEEQFSVLAFINSRWISPGLPQCESMGKAIMMVVRQGKALWR